MASAELSSGRVSPILTEALITAAAGNAGRRVVEVLPCHFNLSDASEFEGSFRTLPLDQIYGDKRAMGTGFLKQGNNAPARDLTRERDFDTVAYACEAEAAKVFVGYRELKRTMNDRIAGINLRTSRALQLMSTFRDVFEYDGLSAVFNTTNHQNATVAALTDGAGVAWDSVGSSPAQDGGAVQDLIRAKTGGEAKWAVMTHDVLRSLQRHPETLEMVLKGDATKGVAMVAGKPRASAGAVLNAWREHWELEELFVVKAMRNSANPGQAGVLAEMVTGKVAFHNSDAIKTAVQVEDNVDALGGLCSIACIHEEQFVGREIPSDDPEGVWMLGQRSYCWVTPGASAAVRPSYILTSVNG